MNAVATISTQKEGLQGPAFQTEILQTPSVSHWDGLESGSPCPHQALPIGASKRPSTFSILKKISAALWRSGMVRWYFMLEPQGADLTWVALSFHSQTK